MLINLVSSLWKTTNFLPYDIPAFCDIYVSVIQSRCNSNSYNFEKHGTFKLIKVPPVFCWCLFPRKDLRKKINDDLNSWWGGIRKMVYVTAVVRHLFPCIDFSPGNKTGMMEIKHTQWIIQEMRFCGELENYSKQIMETWWEEDGRVGRWVNSHQTSTGMPSCLRIRDWLMN